MALETYRKKRNFAATAEPKGAAPVADSNIFVVQKHDATRLHYDFRLALDGVLKSWAVTRGPSLDPGEKRLAVAVEDHPLEYADFEGTIAKGEYGGGSVIVWDKGTWAPLGDAHKGLEEGPSRIRASWARSSTAAGISCRMHGKPGEKRENWLLIKGEDEFARAADEADILEERPESINTGRTIDQLEGEAPGWSSKTGKIEKPDGGRRPRPSPNGSARRRTGAVDHVARSRARSKAPCPALSSRCWRRCRKTPPTGERWLHEIKFDGYRLQAHIEDGKVTLWTRGGLDWTEKFGDGVRRGAPKPARARRLDRRRNGGRERERRRRVLAAASGPQRRDASTASPITPSIASISTDADLREAPLIRRKELLEPADRNRGRRRPLQLPFRGGRQARVAARLRARSRRHRLEGQPIRSTSRAAARAGSRPSAPPGRNS